MTDKLVVKAEELLKPNWAQYVGAALPSVFETIEYEPSDEQMAFHTDPHRVRLVAGGIRGGKSFSSAMDLVARASYTSWLNAKNEVDGFSQLYWIVGPDYEQTREEFRYIEEAFEKCGYTLVSKPSKPEGKSASWTMKWLEVGTITTKTSADISKLASVPPDGIIMSEAAQQEYGAYLACRSRIIEKAGWLIMSGCLTGDTLVLTDDGMKRIDNIVGVITKPIDLGIYGLQGKDKSTLAYFNGVTETLKVKMSRGIEIEGTPDHKVIVRREDGSVVWIPLSELTWDTRVAIPYGMQMFGPVDIDKDDAYEIGLYIAEGYMSPDDRLTMATGDREIADFFKGRGYYPTKRKAKNGVISHWRKTDHDLADEWRELGFDLSLKATKKVIPDGVLRFNKESLMAVLQGMYDGDGTATDRGVIYYTSSRELARQLQMLLLNYGVPAELNQRIMHYEYKGIIEDKIGYSVNASDGKGFAKLIGFRLKRKQKKAKKKKSPSFRRGQANAGSHFLDHKILWCRVKDTEVGFAATYDLHVPNSHSYWANGLMVHNTFEGSLGWYPDNFLAWQNGLRENKSFSIPTWANRKVFPGGRQDKEIINIEAEMPADLFMERFGAVPFKPHTLVFRDFTHERNVREDCVYTPGKPVEIWIDSGYDPGYYHVSAMQFHRGEKGMEVAWQIDEIHVQRLTAPEVIEIAKSKPWWGDVVDGVIDVAGRQHHAQKSQIEIWLELTGIYLMSNVVPILDGIERHRTMLVDPSTKLPRLFHNPENVYTIKEYSLYKRKPDKETAAISEIPMDRDNHAMKSIAYGLFHRYGPVQRMKPRKGRVAVL